jgi:hypothetical protein
MNKSLGPNGKLFDPLFLNGKRLYGMQEAI